ncbi:BatD family protein [Formosa haliotis]|uniref:BatD family protein n=1 Tax=Formosa haliotis TaxID=1555194 RepID=UPI000826C3B2|nr:BatD family protein [Formosa haliotis]
MVAKLKLTAVLFLLCSALGYSQHLVSYVTTNHNEAYIGQPVQMTVSVYTSTWFTSGINLGNIQVDGALTVYFRSVSSNKTFSGKQYSGVDFIYNVFPTQEGTITIPALEINVESPQTGGYKGIKHVIHTKPKSITVKGVPLGYSPDNWLVCGNLTINEKWNSDIKHVKVGDVLQRTISRTASGTLGEFIPAVAWDSVAGVSIYPKRPSVNTNKTKTYVSASRTEGANYLFEKEGPVTLPRIEFVHWNYNTHKFYKKIIDSVTINVAPNPDLKMLSGIKKQLEAETVAESEEDKPFLILGLPVKTFIKYLLFCLVALFLLFTFLRWAITTAIKRHKAYKVSERYAFKKVVLAIHHDTNYAVLNALKIWLLKLNPEIPSMEAFLQRYGTPDALRNYQQLEKRVLEASSSTYNASAFKKDLEAARTTYLQYHKAELESKPKDLSKSDWLNPTAPKSRY